eukprot:CAMPEP_0170168052 /NCGR_PEP_ID=MMETSP0040_2-20121228/1248_1 /TAXON_ID=641309 /ORGANISM="Lotharella oceanica, Strain CCMP622" /LENGTH=156 /DNA_ID=CAMNT_0010406225 /DNA_START=76 /DNA_END=547 /DNA_ORIENTATION=+
MSSTGLQTQVKGAGSQRQRAPESGKAADSQKDKSSSDVTVKRTPSLGSEHFEGLDQAIADLKQNVSAYWMSKLEEKDEMIVKLEKELTEMREKIVASEARWKKARDHNKTLAEATEKLKGQIKKLTKPLMNDDEGLQCAAGPWSVGGPASLLLGTE